MACFVPNCPSGKQIGLESHSFRPDLASSQEWIRILGQFNFGKVFNPQKHWICHRHFHPHEIIKGEEVTINGKCVLLPWKKNWKIRTGIIPTIFPGT
jgi:hypothetical protein